VCVVLCGVLWGLNNVGAPTPRRVSNHKPWKIKSSDGRKVTGV
jgi:hypothetical protein